MLCSSPHCPGMIVAPTTYRSACSDIFDIASNHSQWDFMEAVKQERISVMISRSPVFLRLCISLLLTETVLTLSVLPFDNAHATDAQYTDSDKRSERIANTMQAIWVVDTFYTIIET